MGSVFRMARGRCSCREQQPDRLRRAVCDDLLARLEMLRKRLTSAGLQLPTYAEEVQNVQGREVRFQTIFEELTTRKPSSVIRTGNARGRDNFLRRCLADGVSRHHYASDQTAWSAAGCAVGEHARCKGELYAVAPWTEGAS